MNTTSLAGVVKAKTVMCKPLSPNHPLMVDKEDELLRPEKVDHFKNSKILLRLGKVSGSRSIFKIEGEIACDYDGGLLICPKIKPRKGDSKYEQVTIFRLNENSKYIRKNMPDGFNGVFERVSPTLIQNTKYFPKEAFKYFLNNSKLERFKNKKREIAAYLYKDIVFGTTRKPGWMTSGKKEWFCEIDMGLEDFEVYKGNLLVPPAEQ